VIVINIKKALINPLFLFLAIWITVFTLFSLCISETFIPLKEEFLLCIGATGLSAIVGHTCSYFSLLCRHQQKSSQIANKTLSLGFIKLLFCFICITFITEVIVFDGVPLIWVFIGVSKSYFDYGIPTLHGFFNAVLIFEGTICFWVIVTKKPSSLVWIIFLSCIIIPILAISRQVVTSLLVQCFFVFIGTRYKYLHLKKGQILLFVGVIFVLFSVLGIIRTNSESLRNYSALKPEYEWMPTEMLWPYMYLTTPLNNFVNLTSSSFDNTWGYSSVSKFTPTVIRQTLQQIFWSNMILNTPPPVVRNFNVSTYASILYTDFGWIGVIIFTFLIILMSSKVFHRFTKYNSLYDLLLLSIFNQMIVFSFFDNLFLLLGVSFQLFLVIMFRKNMVNVFATSNHA